MDPLPSYDSIFTAPMDKARLMKARSYTYVSPLHFQLKMRCSNGVSIYRMWIVGAVTAINFLLSNGNPPTRTTHRLTNQTMTNTQLIKYKEAKVLVWLESTDMFFQKSDYMCNFSSIYSDLSS